jgi:cell division protein FtsL
MATLELEREQVLSVEEQAQRHNAMINERYRRLRDAENNQFARETQDVRASVIAPEKTVFVAPVAESPVVEQMPQITEFVPTHTEMPVFTTEKFNAVQDVIESPVAPMQVSTAPVELYTTSATQAPEYMLTGMAKTVLAVFSAVVVAMTALICVNSHVIRQKTIRIQNLEQKKEQLLEMNEEIQRRLEAAQSDETIAQYAQSQGMILGN